MIKNKNIYDNFIVFTIGIIIIMGNSATIDLSGGRIYKGIPVKIIDLCLIIILFLNLSSKIKKNKILEFKFILFWIFWGTISIFLNFYIYRYTLNEIQYGILYPIRFFIYILAIIPIVTNLTKKFKFEKILQKINNMYTIACLIGVIQLLIFPVAFDYYNLLRKFNIYILNPDPHYHRLISTYLDPNFFGSILIIPIGITLASLCTEKYKVKNLTILLIQIITLFLTVSRSGILGLGILLGIFFFMSIGKKINKTIIYLYSLIIFLGVLFTLLFSDRIRVIRRILSYENDPSAIARFSSWKIAFQQIENNFMIGTGYNMLGFYTGNSNVITGFGSNSSLLFIFITTGIIGLFIFCLYICIYIYKLIKYRSEKNFYYSNSLIGITISSLIISNFNNLLLYPLWIIPFMIITNIYFQTQKLK